MLRSRSHYTDRVLLAAVVLTVVIGVATAFCQSGAGPIPEKDGAEPQDDAARVVVSGNRLFNANEILAFARRGGWVPGRGVDGLSVLQEAYFREGYLAAASPEKWLSFHIGTHFESFYLPAYVDKLRGREEDIFAERRRNLETACEERRCRRPSAGSLLTSRG